MVIGASVHPRTRIEHHATSVCSSSELFCCSGVPSRCWAMSWRWPWLLSSPPPPPECPATRRNPSRVRTCAQTHPRGRWQQSAPRGHGTNL
eukprot:13911802-Alexandrium_andersonii.AAC.1